MNSITKDYLTEIVFKKATETIEKRRESKQHQFDNEPYPGATDEEVLDFILTIPYFDEKLKDFLLGNLADDTIIISQAWENEFIKKTRLWADSRDWLQGSNYFLDETNSRSAQNTATFLRLPY